MNRVDQNINKDMIECELIDVESLDFSDDQTWLYAVPQDSGVKVDIVDWNLSCDWPNEDSEYLQMEKELMTVVDNILKDPSLSLPDKQRFDSGTYVRPKKRVQRPSIQSIVEVSPHPSLHPALNPAHHMNPLNSSGNKYLTYNKYTNPLGGISPMLRLKTFNVDANTENSLTVREYAMKRRSLIQDEDPQLEDMDGTLTSEVSERLSMEHAPSKPINIDLSQPAHNIHNTFNKGLTNMMNERGSLNMYQSGESLMRMSPPSLVSSVLMENSGNFNPESLEERRSMPSYRDSGLPMSGRDSIDPMMTSMTLSILDEKDMSTSFLSQTTYPDNDSLMDSLPPSLVSSVNSSYVVNSSRLKEDTNIFSSATFTHLEQSEKLLSARPRCQLYNSFRRESGIKSSESYTKSREEACQIDAAKVLNENADKKESPKPKPDSMAETITLHFGNNKFRNDAEKENFETDDAFYKDMGLLKPEETGKSSMNVHTFGKQELNEIIQARQKLSLARKGLPSEPDKPLPNQIDTSAIETIQLPNQKVITVPRQNVEKASELLPRRRAMNGFEKIEPPARETPKRNATFKKLSPRVSAIDTTVVYMQEEKQANAIIDINSATLNLIDGERTLQDEEWGSQERAMVGSSESTDTGTFSSSSPPNSVPDTAPQHDPRAQVSSTPLMATRKGAKKDLLDIHSTISPIYDMINDKSYNIKVASVNSQMERTYDMQNYSAKRDILARQTSPEKRPTTQMRSPSNSRVPATTVSYATMVPPAGVPRKTNLPTSKLRQYSSHRELSRIPAGPPTTVRGAPAGRSMMRRNVYASNPALSPTASAPLDAYVIGANVLPMQKAEVKPARPVLTNPPALIRQGTETLRRERPQSQLVAPRDPPTTRPYSIAGASQLRVNRPASGPPQKPAPAVPVVEQPRPMTSNEPRLSGLPRPSRLPAPRRTLRPPSVYSVAPTGEAENY